VISVTRAGFLRAMMLVVRSPIVNCVGLGMCPVEANRNGSDLDGDSHQNSSVHPSHERSARVALSGPSR
jgi:hypothetical protein